MGSDLERDGGVGCEARPSVRDWGQLAKSYWDKLALLLPPWPRRAKTTPDPASATCRQQDSRVARTNHQVEDYPDGLPRYSALIASHDTFQICRRFTRLRARLILLKQDRISVLEQKLDKLDREEDVSLRLGSCREDDNPQSSCPRRH